MLTDLLSLILHKNLSKRKIEFAFIVHPRNVQDIYKKYKYLKLLPKKVVELMLLCFWPTYGGKIKIENKETKEILWGAIIICPLTAKQMLGKRKLALKRVTSSALLAKIYGAKVIGLGALSSVVTDNGNSMKEVLPEIIFTSGNSLTVYIAFEDIIKLVQKYEITGPVAIIGATGSIGKALSKMLAEKINNKIVIIGRSKERINLLKTDIIQKNFRQGVESIQATVNISDASSAEMLVVVTSAVGAVVNDDIIKNTRIIYDLTQPKNTPEHIQKKKSIIYVDGSLIKLPDNIEIGLDIGLPKGVAFACLSETIIIAMSEHHHLISKGELDIDLIHKIGQLKNIYDFNSLIHHV